MGDANTNKDLLGENGTQGGAGEKFLVVGWTGYGFRLRLLCSTLAHFL